MLSATGRSRGLEPPAVPQVSRDIGAGPEEEELEKAESYIKKHET
jgi:hypothetical protein